MGRGSGAFKFILIILVSYLLVHGSYAQNGEGADSDNAQLSEINGTITGTINGTVDITEDAETDSEPNPIPEYEWLLLIPILYGNLLFLSWISRFFDKMNFCFVVFVLTSLLVLSLYFYFFDLQRLTKENISESPILSNLSLIISITFSVVIIAFLYNVLFKRKKGGYNIILDKGKVKVDKDHVIIDIDGLTTDGNKVKIGRDNIRINKNRVIIDENCLVVDLHDIVRNFIIILTGLMWPTILFYLYLEGKTTVTIFGTESLRFPVYIIAAASLGILSYLYLSIEEIFCQLIPEYKKISIAWSFLRRITIAPFIALIGFYLLNQLRNVGETDDINDYFVFVFSFFAGVFTKTIEEWIYAWVQKLLPGDKKNEFETRTEYQIKESEFVKKLRFDEDLAYALYNAKVRSIEELAACDPENLRNRLNFDTRNLGEHMGLLLTEQKEKFDSYSKEQVKTYINRARTYMNCKKKVEELVRGGKVGIEEAHKMLNYCSEEKIKDYKEEAQERLESEEKELESEKKELK